MNPESSTYTVVNDGSNPNLTEQRLPNEGLDDSAEAAQASEVIDLFQDLREVSSGSLETNEEFALTQAQQSSIEGRFSDAQTQIEREFNFDGDKREFAVKLNQKEGREPLSTPDAHQIMTKMAHEMFDLAEETGELSDQEGGEQIIGLANGIDTIQGADEALEWAEAVLKSKSESRLQRRLENWEEVQINELRDVRDALFEQKNQLEANPEPEQSETEQSVTPEEVGSKEKSDEQKRFGTVLSRVEQELQSPDVRQIFRGVMDELPDDELSSLTADLHQINKHFAHEKSEAFSLPLNESRAKREELRDEQMQAMKELVDHYRSGESQEVSQQASNSSEPEVEQTPETQANETPNPSSIEQEVDVNTESETQIDNPTGSNEVPVAEVEQSQFEPSQRIEETISDSESRSEEVEPEQDQEVEARQEEAESESDEQQEKDKSAEKAQKQRKDLDNVAKRLSNMPHLSSEEKAFLTEGFGDYLSNMEDEEVNNFVTSLQNEVGTDTINAALKPGGVVSNEPNSNGSDLQKASAEVYRKIRDKFIA